MKQKNNKHSVRVHMAGGQVIDIAELPREQQLFIVEIIVAVCQGRQTIDSLEAVTAAGLVMLADDVRKGQRPDANLAENTMLFDIASRLLRQEDAKIRTGGYEVTPDGEIRGLPKVTDAGWARLLANIEPIPHAPECTCAKCK